MNQIMRYYGNTIITILSCAMVLSLLFGAYKAIRSDIGQKTALTMIKATGSGDNDAQYLLDSLSAKTVTDMTGDVLASNMTDYKTDTQIDEVISGSSVMYQTTEKMKRAGDVYYFWKDESLAGEVSEDGPDTILTTTIPGSRAVLLGITDTKRRYESANGSQKQGTYYYPVISIGTDSKGHQEIVPDDAVCWINENTGTCYVRFPHEGYYCLRTSIISERGQENDVNIYLYVGRGKTK